MASSLNGTILIFVTLIIFSCKKQKTETNILKLAELKDYKVTETKINDSIIKVFGENDNYIIEGNLNVLNYSKQGWWKIKNKKSNDWAEIEYIFFDHQIENQIRIYKNGVFDSNSSKFYNVSPHLFIFHFPKSYYNTYNVDFEYIVSDAVLRKKITRGNLKLKNKDDYYSCSIPIKENENVVGIVSRFSKFKQRDSVLLAVDRMFIKPLKKIKITDTVKLTNPK